MGATWLHFINSGNDLKQSNNHPATNSSGQWDSPKNPNGKHGLGSSQVGQGHLWVLSPPAAPLAFLRDNVRRWRTGKLTANCPGRSETVSWWEVQLGKSNFKSPRWPASLAGWIFLRLFFSPVLRALHITEHYRKKHNHARKAPSKHSKLIYSEYTMMRLLPFKNSSALRLWSRSFSWKLLHHPQFVPPADGKLLWLYDLCDWHSTPCPHESTQPRSVTQLSWDIQTLLTK